MCTTLAVKWGACEGGGGAFARNFTEFVVVHPWKNSVHNQAAHKLPVDRWVYLKQHFLSVTAVKMANNQLPPGSRTVPGGDTPQKTLEDV